MKKLLIGVGAVVVLLMLASAGVLRGEMCAGDIGCVKAQNTSIIFHRPNAQTP